VTQNGTPIYPIAGVYTIPNITQPVTVAVTGVELNPADYTQLDAAIALAPSFPDAYYTSTTMEAFCNTVADGQALSRDLRYYHRTKWITRQTRLNRPIAIYSCTRPDRLEVESELVVDATARNEHDYRF
jgi:hypothetical protein